MGHKELRFSYNDPRIKDPETITKFVTDEMAKIDRDIMMDDVIDLIDDDDSRQRILKIQNPRKHFFIRRG